MANTVIQLKFSTVTATPTTLNVAEPAYSYSSNTLFIGSPDSNGSIAIGGKFYLDQQQIIFDSSNAAFAAANVSNATDTTQNNSINAAFTRANTASNTANSAFAAANAANATDTTQNNSITAAFTRANNSINANTGGIITGDLSVTGNLTVTGLTTYTNTSTVLIADNIITVNAAINSSSLPTVNAGIEVDRGAQPNTSILWIETSGKWAANNGNGSIFIASDSAESYANSAFAAANAATATDATQNNSINAAFTRANTASNTANSAFAAANAANATDTTQNNSITAAFTRANSASNTANSAFAAANAANATDTTQNNSITAAFTRANNSINANTGGTITGNLIVGNLSATGTVTSTNFIGSVIKGNNAISVEGADGENGGGVTLSGGDGDATGFGGNVDLNAGSGLYGGTIGIVGGSSSTAGGSGGSITLLAGPFSGASQVYGARINMGGGGSGGEGGTLDIEAGQSVGTDIAGPNLTITSGRGTGNSTSGSLTIKTYPPTTSGNTSQSLETRLEINNLGQVTMPAGIASTSNTTGTLVVTGGVGVSGNLYADAVYDGGIEVIRFANNAYNFANAAFAAANAANATDTTQNNSITAAFTRANSASNTANSAFAAANAAFTRANNSINANTGGTITGDLSVTGNLSIGGNTTFVNTEVLTVEDSLIKLANNQTSSDVLDIGFYGLYNSSGQKYAGLARPAATDTFFLFKGLTQDPTANALASGSITAANVATLIANVQAYSVTINNQDINQFATNAYTQANTAVANALAASAAANSAFATANSASNTANSASASANIDFTNISTTAANYGSATAVAAFRVEANGRISSANSTTIALAASAITSGTLGVARGGTGAATFTTNGVLLGQGTSAFNTASSSTEGHVLTINASGVPTFAHLQGGTF